MEDFDSFKEFLKMSKKIDIYYSTGVFPTYLLSFYNRIGWARIYNTYTESLSWTSVRESTKGKFININKKRYYIDEFK